MDHLSFARPLRCFELAIIYYAERSHTICGAPRAREKEVLRPVFFERLDPSVGEGVVPSRPLSKLPPRAGLTMNR